MSWSKFVPANSKRSCPKPALTATTPRRNVSRPDGVAPTHKSGLYEKSRCSRYSFWYWMELSGFLTTALTVSIICTPLLSSTGSPFASVLGTCTDVL